MDGSLRQAAPYRTLRLTLMKFWKLNSVPTEKMFWLLLFTVFCVCGRVWANTDYYRHTVFDNSLTSDTYFYSAGTSNGPSSLEQKDWRLPVDTKTFLTPPNALRLQWQSQPGGGWEAEVRLGDLRNRFPEMSGHNLYFLCFSPTPVSADDLPLVVLSTGREGLQVAEFPA